MLARLKSLAGQSAVYGLGNLLPKAIGFLLIPLYTQFLTPADYGILAFVTTLSAVLGIFFELGLGGAVTRFHYDFQENPGEQRRYYGTIWLFLTGFSLALALLLEWQGERLFSLLFAETPFHPYGRLGIWLSFFTIASVLPMTLFRVREKAFAYTFFTITRFVLNLLAIIYFVTILRQGAAGSLSGQLLTAAVFFIPFTLYTLRNLKPAIEWDKLKASLAFGLPLVPHQLSGWALNVSDRILLERVVTLDALGLYSLGYKMATILDMVLYSINLAWAPFFYRTASQDPEAPSVFARLTTYYTVLLLTLGLGTSLLAREAIILMSRPAYYDAYQIVPVVTLAYIAHGFYFMVVNQLFFTKNTRRLPFFTGLSAVVNIGLNLLLLDRFGIWAAAWNTAIGYTLLFILVFREAQRVYRVPYEYRRLAVLFVTAAATYMLGSLVALESLWLSLTVKLSVIALFPAMLLLLRFFTPRELTGFRLLVQRLLSRINPFSSSGEE